MSAWKAPSASSFRFSSAQAWAVRSWASSASPLWGQRSRRMRASVRAWVVVLQLEVLAGDLELVARRLRRVARGDVGVLGDGGQPVPEAVAVDVADDGAGTPGVVGAGVERDDAAVVRDGAGVVAQLQVGDVGGVLERPEAQRGVAAGEPSLAQLGEELLVDRERLAGLAREARDRSASSSWPATRRCRRRGRGAARPRPSRPARTRRPPRRGSLPFSPPGSPPSSSSAFPPPPGPASGAPPSRAPPARRPPRPRGWSRPRGPPPPPARPSTRGR